MAHIVGCSADGSWMDARGPVIFKQKREGCGGRLFTMYKFRSMTVGHGGSSVLVAGESRITPLGAKLRRYKLDELPELWNVLIGDMSFVGPRPDVPGYADMLKGDDREVLKLRPGITGPVSLKYRDEEELLSKIPKSLSLRHFIPLLFLLLPLIVAFFWQPAIWLSVAAFSICLCAVSAISVKLAIKKHLNFFYLVATFFVLHISYGCGSLIGILKLPFLKK